VSESLFEQYKASLRRGHLAALAGQLEEALEAYRAAARLVPERTLPLASEGTVLHRLDRWPEAAEVFDRALQLAPDDEATLRARASAREQRGMHSGAAADLERLAFVLDVSGRVAEAAEVARRAAELDPSADRTALAGRLATAGRRRAAGSTPVSPEPADEAGSDFAVIESEVIGDEPVPTVAPVASPAAAVGQESGPGGPLWPAVDLPSPPAAAIVGPPPDPETLIAEAVARIAAGDPAGARDLMLTAATVHRAAGRLDAALEACLELLGTSPGDPQVHLAIANLQLDRGWSAVATEKIDLLVRLTSLTGDTQAEADVHGLASERLRDAPAGVAATR
jgi:tetratricopeptide (TPR) repeat protein